jgi:hypothetical protein
MTQIQQNKNQPWKFVQPGMALIERLWWHARAYGTIVSIMLLTFASLGFLYIHWSRSRLLPIFKNRSIGEQEWDTLKSK